MNICILIPAHNEAEQIGEVISSLRTKGLDVLVVDDGSTDGSEEASKAAGAQVFRNNHNQGKGFSLQRGFDHIISQDYDALVTMDGDGQHAVEDIEKFLELFEKDRPDIICGNRMQQHEGMPFIRLVTNRIMSALISLVCRQMVPDTQCGYRLVKCEVLRDIQLSSSAFEIDSEVLIKAAKKGYRIASVPVRTIYGNEVSRIDPIFDTARFIVYIIRELLVR